MKITNLLYTVLISSILIFSPSLLLSQTRFTTAPVDEVAIPPDGFCCTNGQVISSSQAQCKKKGQYYQTRTEALRYCRPNTVFCCINGKVSEISTEQCKRNQGTAYSTGAEAKRKCKSKAIYCCLNGKIVKVSPEDCKKKRGTAYATSSEAKRKCKPEEVYCCLKGKLKRTSPGDCKKNRGTIYKTATEAKRKCKPEAVYCCLKGSIKKVSSAECKTKKGAPYRSEKEARKNCGWCCADNKLFSATPDNCRRKRGEFFTSKVQADRQCKEQPQCCIKGKLFTYSKRECDNKKGKYYRSYGEAKYQCRSVAGVARPKVSRQSISGEVTSPNIKLSSPMGVKVDGKSNVSSGLLPVGGGLDVPIITVVNRTVTPQTPKLGQEATASFIVKNIGSVATSGPLPFVLKIYSSDENGIETLGGSSIYRYHFNQFEPGDEQTILLTGPTFHLGLHAASLVISRNGASVPGGYSGDIVIPSEPSYQFFQVAQPYDLGFYGYGVRHEDGYLKFKIKNYGPTIPQEVYNQLGLGYSIDNGGLLKYPMTTMDPGGILKTAGNIHTFQWPLPTSTQEIRAYRFKIGLLLPGSGGINTGAPDSNPTNNKKMIDVGGLPDLVVCFKRFMTHHPGNYTYPPRVKNIGNAASGPAILKFWIEGKGTANFTVDSLPPGGEDVLQREVRWWLAEMGTDTMMSRDFRLVVDRNKDVDEGVVGESNNVITGVIYIKRWQHTTATPGTSQTLCSDVPGSSYE